MMRKLILGIVATVALLGSGMPEALAQTKNRTNVIDEVAWIVGDEAILLSDIERQRLYFESMGERFEGDARCIIPEQMAIQKLFLNQAQIDSVYPNDQMVNQSVNQWIEAVTNELGSREKVEEYLGMNMAQIRADRRRVVSEEYVVMQMRQKIVGDIQVSPSEVNRFYDTVNKDSLPFMPQTVEVQIVTQQPNIPMGEVDRVKQQLVGYTEKVNKGEMSFETLARIYSEDSNTALKGGEMGFVGRAELEPEFANVAFGLQDTNKVSRIVRTAKGYHIMQLIEKRGDQVNVRHIMLRPRVANEDLIATTNRMDSIAHLIRVDSLPFQAAARLYSYDEDTRMGNGQMVNTNERSQYYGTSRFTMEDLPQEVSAQVAKMAEGEVSAPFTMMDKNKNTIVAIVLLKRRAPGHRANVVDDYQVIKNIVLQKKQNDTLNEWIQKKQKTTYVSISPEYRQCEFQYPGWLAE
ncbi:MAG: peptidylprolyl isomerase [Bacteroidales bacterium]|uniref:peptidylprolyl isomerase n=1 Tax=Porphyromonas sp. TaxID=1924944 RepID=UPI0029729ED5|nr:peptidylprolyl isomerase [Porphyromonas sp.]MDD7438924.1 peptidylprolyl isomerase [Bacteroidales bacterium]MDY3066508.1 peptidylprolyl isomerase [Porphyromonas sp.]